MSGSPPGRDLGQVPRFTAVAAIAITATWLLGTGYGFHLIRQAKRTNGACPLPRP